MSNPIPSPVDALPAAPPPAEHRLLMDAVFRRRFPVIGLRRIHPVQNVPMEPGLSIKNMGTAPFPGATAKGFRIKKQESLASYTLNYEEQMIVPPLNPGESTSVWWPLGAAQMDGLVTVTCDFDAGQNHVVWVYGRSFEMDEKPIRLEMPNSASLAVVIEQRNAAEQRRTNKYLLLLAVLTFVQGVWGLNSVVIGAFHAIGNLLALVGRWLIAVGGA